MKRSCIWLFLAVFMPCAAQDGYIFGADHCFYFTTPNGWVANNQLGANDGLPFVFYPLGGSWAHSPTVIYARIADRDGAVRTIEDKVKDTLRDFRSNGSPHIKAQRIGPITSKSGAKGELYKYSGDQWGNDELVAYFLGPHTINLFVMTSRNAKDFEAQRPALVALAGSYRPAKDCKPCHAKDAQPAALPNASQRTAARCSHS